MENKKKEIEKFYKQIFSDEKLKERIREKAKKIVTEKDLRKLIREEIMPLMKKFKVNFSEEELLEYEEKSLKELSAEDLEGVSGGMSFKSALMTGGVLSLALLGGVGLSANTSAMEVLDVTQEDNSNDNAAKFNKQDAHYTQFRRFMNNAGNQLHGLLEYLGKNNVKTKDDTFNFLKNLKRQDLESFEGLRLDTEHLASQIEQFDQAKILSGQWITDNRFLQSELQLVIDLEQSFKEVKDEVESKEEVVQAEEAAVTSETDKKEAHAEEAEVQASVAQAEENIENKDIVTQAKEALVTQEAEEKSDDIKDGTAESKEEDNNQTEDKGSSEAVEAQAESEESKNENSFSWKITNGILNISGSGPMPDFGYLPTEHPWYEDMSNIKEINISEGITSISMYAFNNCENLVKVSLPQSLEKIGIYAFSNCNSLVEVSLPQNLEEIGAQAFNNCERLTEISIPANVTSFGGSIFVGCTSLTELTLNSDVAAANVKKLRISHLKKLTLGKDVTNFDRHGFSGFHELNEFAVGEGNENFEAVDGMLAKKDEQGLTLICCPQSKEGSIVVPSKVTQIESFAFYECERVSEEVILKSGATVVDSEAFENSNVNCVKVIINNNDEFEEFSNDEEIAQFVETISLGQDVKDMENIHEILNKFPMLKAIEVDINNPDYTSVNGALCSKNGEKIISYPANKADKQYIVPNGVKEIGDSAFANTKNLSYVILPTSISSIGARAFSKSSIETMSIPSRISRIEKETFANCKKLKSVVLGYGVLMIGDSAFENCTNLTNVELGKNVVNICAKAFKNSKINNISFPPSLEAIGEDAFNRCYNVRNIPDLPTSMPALEENILESLEDNEEIVKKEDFENNNTSTHKATPKRNYIKISGERTDNYWQFDEDTGTLVLGGYGFLSGSPDGFVVKRCGGGPPWDKCCLSAKKLVIKNGITHIEQGAFSFFVNLEEIEIPDSVEEIEYGAFLGCKNLETVKLGTGLKKIGQQVFDSCISLKNINIPSSVEEIGDAVFSGCTNLEYINIPSNVSNIEHATFAGCSSLSRVDFSEDGNKLKIIPEYMFGGCPALTFVKLPPSVQEVGEGAFANCHNLVCVNWEGEGESPKLGKDVFKGDPLIKKVTKL